MKKHKSLLNLIFNISSLLVSMGLSFWLTPFIVNTIGSESYGFVPLTQQMINYMTVLTVSVTAMSGRFFTVAKSRNDLPLAQDYFSSALSASLLGSLVIFLPMLVGAFNIGRFLNVPPYLLFDVRASFLIYGVMFILTFVNSVFCVGAFANNALYVTSGNNIINAALKAVFTLALLLLFAPRIWFVSLGALGAAFIMLLLNVAAFKRLEPEIRIFRISFKKIGALLSSGMWASLSEIGVILFLQIDLLVANWNLGAGAAGDYSVALTLPSILRTFGATIISIFAPTVVSFFALGKTDQIIKYVNNAVKFTGVALSLPIGLVCGMGGAILSWWINPDYAKYGLLLFVLTVHLPINLSMQAVMSVQTAYNRIRVPAFVTLAMGTLNFILAYCLTKYFGWGAMGIALSGSVVLTAKNTLFTPLYVAKITGQKWNAYFKGILKPFVSTVFVAFLAFLAQKFLAPDSFLKIFLVCAAIGAVYLPFAYFVMLGSGERRYFMERVGELIGKS